MLTRALIDSTDEVLTETPAAEPDTVFIWPAEVVDLQDWRIRRAGVRRHGRAPGLRKYVPKHRAETTRWS
jgi:hypothetical protein